ncbi:hypothetical protein RJ639_022149 [Escallonia herrerae]|uniref:Ankyrin repeat domain-containing protein, chloroplastic n=1 Tax=Escallonia herrerae TaxID=1293975 RepID=A0AA88S6K8_9ASTE|nr:hypothetical protein RJ639_025149 [Escallonia herrerae]KAK3000733.1 hypothetical protein RJ639_022149 [Escallonia herrerae]
MALPTVLGPPKICTLLSSSPLSPPTAHRPFQTLSFQRKPSTLNPPFSLSSSLHHQQHQYDDDDEELVIGDCLVFEQGVFQDPHLEQAFTPNPNTAQPKPKNSNKSSKVEIQPENLIPEKWKEAQEAINITKKERRKLAQQLEFGRKLEKKREGLRPIRYSVSVEEDYVAYRDAKLAQLKPFVLDNPSFVADESENGVKTRESEGDHGVLKRSSRMVPRNPRLAVYGGTLDDVSEFLSSGNYDPEAARKNEGQKLFTKEEKVLMNMRVPDLKAATSDKWKPLHTLAASGDIYLVGALLRHNFDINVLDKDGLSVLHKVILGKKQAIFNLLLRESANPFVRDKGGATLMHYAVRTASSQMIKILLLYNVDINLQDNDGWTPLHLAVQSRRTDVVRLLIIKGADKTLRNRDGLTPLDLCLYSGRDTRTYELIKLIKQLPKQRKFS